MTDRTDFLDFLLHPSNRGQEVDPSKCPGPGTDGGGCSNCGQGIGWSPLDRSVPRPIPPEHGYLTDEELDYGVCPGCRLLRGAGLWPYGWSGKIRRPR